MSEAVSPRRAHWKQTGYLVTWGLLGVLSLLLQPAPEQLLRERPDLAELPVWLLRLLGLLNPLLLLVVAAWVGVLLAYRMGLRSIVAGTARLDDGRFSWRVAAAAGLVTGVVVVSLDTAAVPWLGDAWSAYLSQAARPDARTLAIGLLYGGITEEILMRWGLMSMLAWALWTLGGRRGRGTALVVACVTTALVFGTAHLPALGAQVELSAGIVVRTVLLNALAALVYGWVFWRYHLEAAMLSHACSHLAIAMLRVWL